MLNKIKKISRDVRAFTLTEVMIGMMILTVAIVSASNLLMGIIDSNRNNLTTLQAYYLSQEGLEMVRNIRDTNWLHNRDWLGASSGNLWGGNFEVPKDSKSENKYAVNLLNNGMNVVAQKTSNNASPAVVIAGARPWSILRLNEKDSGAKIFRHVSPGVAYMDSTGSKAEDTGFKRTIIFKKYDCEKLNEYSLNLCAEGKFALVQSKVEWDIGAKHRELVLSEVLTNWKGGAL